MKRWGAGSEAASESVVSRKDRRRKENTGVAGASESEEERRGSAELGGASERRRRPPPGKDAQQQKRQKRRRGLEQRRGREEEPVRATCGGSSKNRPGEAPAGRGREEQAGGDGIPAPRASPRPPPRPAVGHRPQPVTTPEPQCPESLQASFRLLGTGGRGHAVSAGLFCQLCACGGYPRML